MVVARNVCIILLCIVVVNSLEAEYEFRRDDGHDAASVNANVVKRRSRSVISKWFTKWLALSKSKEEIRIVMVGLEGAGQTAILSQLGLGEIITTIPSIGFNVKTAAYKQISFTVWDVGSQHKNSLERQYLQNTQALIFVVDSNDIGSIQKARKEFIRILNEDELRDAVILVFANRQEFPNALNAAVVTDKLGLNNIRNRWYIQATSSTGDGLYEGMDWLAEAVDLRTHLLSSI